MNSITFFTYITHIFSPTAIIVACAVLMLFTFIYMYTKKISIWGFFNRERFALFPNTVKMQLIVVKSTVLAAILVAIIKGIFKIPRPANMLIMETGYAFPSGHATLAFAFFTAVAYCLYSYKKIKTGWLLLIFAILVSISRVVLHVHSVRDVIAGGVLGILCTVVVIQVFAWYTKRYAKI